MSFLNYHPWLNFPSHLPKATIRSLCLQFILEECVERLTEISILETTPHDLFLEKFQSFLGFSQLDSSRAFPDKLCFYCNILLQTSKIDQHSLDIRIDGMRRFTLETKLKILNSRTCMDDMFPFIDFCHKLKELFRSFFFSLNPFLFEARTDENVLLKLIKHKNFFNQLEPHFIEKSLHSFFPANIEHLKAIICEGLTKRGFSHIFKEQEQLIEEIEWKNLCLRTQDLV